MKCVLIGKINFIEILIVKNSREWFSVMSLIKQELLAIIRLIAFRNVIAYKKLVSKAFKQSIEKHSWPQPAPALAPASTTSPVIIVIFIVTTQFLPNWK